MKTWQILDAITSRGKTTQKSGGLAAIHDNRKRHLSQFFTPEWLVNFAWGCISSAFVDGKRYRLLDNSVGAASMMRHATPEQFSLHGVDVDLHLVQQTSAALEQLGFNVDIVGASLVDVELSRYSAALINPPFSIQLDSPLIEPIDGVTCYGKHGPNTSAKSHHYALIQALNHADIVCAVVPCSTTKLLCESPDLSQYLKRLVACFHLPRNTFIDESVETVNVDLLIFGKNTVTGKPLFEPINEDSTAVDLKLMARDSALLCAKHILVRHGDTSQPVIRIAASSDKSVRFYRSGRFIKLAFKDAALQGRSMNAIYRARVNNARSHRHPSTTIYEGQHQLSLEVLVMQSNPFKALESICHIIEELGGVPTVDEQLIQDIKRLIKRHQMMMIPFSRTVFRDTPKQFSISSNKLALLNTKESDAIVLKGERVTATRNHHDFIVNTRRGSFNTTAERFHEIFDFKDNASGYWETIHPPIESQYPQAISALRERALALKLNQSLNLEYQFEDLLELAFRPKGSVIGWEMGLGKSRLNAALALLLKGTSLIVLKSRLIDEMQRELKAIQVTDINIINSVSTARELTKVNIISYERLRTPITSKCSITYSKLLKNRIVNLIADEGGVLANHVSKQSQSMFQVGAKRNFISDGTPSPNYPREMLSIAAFCRGQSHSFQQYAIQGEHITPELFNSSDKQLTGRKAFMDSYVMLKWSTNEFLDSGKGARREVPAVNPLRLDDYRDWLAPLIKRRVQQEPDVKKHFDFPVPELHLPIEIDWKYEHLAQYVKTAESFADWYKNYLTQLNQAGKNISLTTILLKLEAVFKAANTPSILSGYANPYHDLTTKELATLSLVKQELEQGRKPIVFARNPVVLERLASELKRDSIKSLVFTGKQSIQSRTEALNATIRNDSVDVMLASMGVTQDGLNLHQLNTFIFYNRSWSSREEFQAIYRLIRPQQKSDVQGYFLHLKGSIDEYQGQLIRWKRLAAESALDFCEHSPDSDEFAHFDVFLNRFLESLPALREQLNNNKAA